MRHAALTTAIALACAVPGLAQAQKNPPASAENYPNKPVRLIVPYPPGGGNDTLARMFGAKLTQAWGQQIVVDNRGGAGTTIGTFSCCTSRTRAADRRSPGSSAARRR